MADRGPQTRCIGCRDLTALADLLGEALFFMGERATSLDASAYAFLENILRPPVESPLKAHALKRPNLEAYCRRMRERYYAER